MLPINIFVIRKNELFDYINKFILKQGVKMLHQYNKTDDIYNNYIHLSELEKSLEALKKISGRIKYETFGELPSDMEKEDDVYHIIIDDAESLEKFIKTKMDNKIEASIGSFHTSLFLEVCLRSVGLEGIEYMLKQKCEVNRTNVFGNSALMYIIYNEDMSEENKLKAIQMLIDAGIDVNMPNFQLNTPLMEALNRAEFAIAEKLIDNGGYILRPPAHEETKDKSTKE